MPKATSLSVTIKPSCHWTERVKLASCLTKHSIHYYRSRKKMCTGVKLIKVPGESSFAGIVWGSGFCFQSKSPDAFRCSQQFPHEWVNTWVEDSNHHLYDNRRGGVGGTEQGAGPCLFWVRDFRVETLPCGQSSTESVSIQSVPVAEEAAWT